MRKYGRWNWLSDHFGENLLQIIFPPRCCGCGAPIDSPEKQKFCLACAARVGFLSSPLCLICGTNLSKDGGDEDRLCLVCLEHRPVFDSARSLVHYRDPVRSLLQRLKFKADTRVVPGLHALMEQSGDWYKKKDYDLIVPVPLYPARLKMRGLNQALVLGRLLFGKELVKIDPTALKKVKNTPAQSELSGADRRKNLSGAFRKGPEADLAGRRICLVDDIFTTGATASECSLILKENGAESVDVLTFARA